MKLASPDLKSRLAAEYVLGTMKGRARRRLEEYARNDPALAAEIANWEARLVPLTARIEPVSPPARVWSRIEARLDGAARVNVPSATSSASTGGWLSSLPFWRGLSLSATTLAALLAVMMIQRQSAPPAQNMLTAVLEDKGEARMVVERPRADLLRVNMVKAWKAAPENSLQLWIVPEGGAPRSIGLIAQDGTTQISMKDLDQLLSGGVAFALSKEPKGGSPTGQPTGMILCKGVIAKLPPPRRTLGVI
jgi:anti-sigma-K factor RskA